MCQDNSHMTTISDIAVYRGNLYINLIKTVTENSEVGFSS